MPESTQALSGNFQYLLIYHKIPLNLDYLCIPDFVSTNFFIAYYSFYLFIYVWRKDNVSFYYYYCTGGT
jgi:hypothetical protein